MLRELMEELQQIHDQVDAAAERLAQLVHLRTLDEAQRQWLASALNSSLAARGDVAAATFLLATHIRYTQPTSPLGDRPSVAPWRPRVINPAERP